MKITLRTITYSLFYVFLTLALAIDDNKETYIALAAALVSLVCFLIIRPGKEEYFNLLTGRTFFYWLGAIIFFLLAFSGKIESVGTWEDVDAFVLWLKFLGCLLLLKASLSLFIRSTNFYKRRLSNMHKSTLEKDKDSFKINSDEKC